MTRATLILGCASAVLLGPVMPARAEVPDCAYHLERAAPGQVLTAEQIDANNTCLQELQQESAATDLRARIADAERKMRGKSEASAVTPSPTAGNLPLPGFPTVLPPSTPVPSAHSSAPQLPAWLPPRIVMIASDRGKMTATLKMPDGSVYDAVKGTALPDGSTVTAIRAESVYIRHDKETVPLANDDGSAQSSQTTPSASLPMVGQSGLRP